MKNKIYIIGGSRTLIVAEALKLAQNDSFDGIMSKVSGAINAKIRAGEDMDMDNDGMQDMYDYAYVRDLYPDTAIYCMNGNMFAISYSVDAVNDTVTLGTPTAVELSYTSATDESARPRTIAGEAFRLQEAAYDSSSGKLTLKVIEAGFNKSQSRYYPATTLKRDFKIFEGAKMFVDHQTEAEQRARPEGSVNDWVAQIGKVWCESDGTIMGEATVIDPQFKSKLDRLNEAKMLKEMGVSIRAVGEAVKQEVDGVSTNYIESLIAARSVDFVTYAGAGGQVEAMESERNSAYDVDLLSETELRKRRPDLVTLIETTAREENNLNKTLEQQLQESNAALAAEKAKNTDLGTKMSTLETTVKESKKVAAQAEISRMLTESKLPEVATTRLKKQFAEAVETTGVKEAIEAETAYIASLGGKTAVKNLGAAANGNGDVKESKTEVDLVKSFQSMGMSEAEAKIAAGKK